MNVSIGIHKRMTLELGASAGTKGTKTHQESRDNIIQSQVITRESRNFHEGTQPGQAGLTEGHLTFHFVFASVFHLLPIRGNQEATELC